MKTTLRLFLVSTAMVIGMLNPLQLFAQSSQDWGATINSLSGKQAISAQAASFQKFGSYPVNKANGIPDVSIPIYTIKSGSLEFPITLSYHMGGIKVEEIASWAGLGWNLSAGGVINRTIKGLPDEYSSGWIGNTASPGYADYPVVKDDGVSTNRFSNYDDYTELLNGYGFGDAAKYHSDLVTDYRDNASDIYTYSIGGVSGKFVYDFDRNMVHIPHSDNKIERNGNNFTITDNKGIRYIFRADQGYTENSFVKTTGQSVPVTWLLAEIVSADGLDSIEFEYAPTAVKTVDETKRLSIIYGAYWNPNLNGDKLPESQYGNDTSSGSYIEGEERLLKSIAFKGGSISFDTAPREDRTVMQRTESAQRLSEIKVKIDYGTQNHDDSLIIKRVVFNHNYFQSSTGTGQYRLRLKLTDIAIYGKKDSVAETYRFDYNTATLPPYYYPGSTDVSYRGQDYWGYYTGRNYNSSMIPSEVLTGTNVAGRGANRNTNESSMKACVLNKITYPTGGYTTFETEANQAPGVSTTAVTAVGGLRIREIRSYTSTSDTNPLVVSYTYENGRQLYPPDQSLWKINISFSTGSHAGTPCDSYWNTFPGAFNSGYSYAIAPGTIYLEDPITPLGQYQGSPVTYGKVTETRGGANGPAGKTVYEYYGSRVSGRYLSGYYTGMDYDQTTMPMDWVNGLLKKMTMYRQESSTYVPVKEIENTYDIQEEEVCHGTVVMDRAVYQGLVSNITGTSATLPSNSGAYAALHYHHYWVTEKTGTQRLVSTVEREFVSASDTGTGTTTSYLYGLGANTTNYLPSRVTVTALPGNTQLKQTDYKYAFEAYSAMKTKNMLDYPYEEKVNGSSGSTIFQSRIYYTTALKPNQVFKSYNSTLPTTNPDLSILQRDSYGHVVESKDRNGIYTVHLWGYKGQHLVAEIVNAQYDQVSSALGSSSPSSILTATTPTSTQITALKNLRTALPGTQVTVYEYEPLVGVRKITDPSGRATSYEYDSSNRLYQTKDHNGNLMQRYQYNMTAN